MGILAKKLHFLAEIINPPLQWGRYFNRHYSEIERLLSQSKELKSDLQDLLKNEEFEDFLADSRLGPQDLEYVAERNIEALEDFYNYLSVYSWMDFNDVSFLQKTLAGYDRYRPGIERRIEQAQRALDEIKRDSQAERASTYGDDYKKMYEDLEGFLKKSQIVTSSVAERVKPLGDKIEAIRQKIRIHRQPGQGLLPHGTAKVEKLYHASVNAAPIYHNGFEDKAKKNFGLGGDQNVISFTHNFNYAREIARSLKEATMIAQDLITPTQVFHWMIKDGVYDKYDGPKNPEKYTTPGEIMELYRFYIALSPRRENTVFFGNMDELMNNLKKVKYQDIGIIEAEVDVEGAEYLPHEYEFRVTPDKVLKLNKVIT